MPKQWYILQVYSGQESAVKKLIEERVKIHKLHDSVGNILVPTENIVEMRAGKKRKSERKFYPGYILLEVELDDHIWHLITHTPKVIGFVGSRADKPEPMKERELDRILQRVQAGVDSPTPKVIFEAGEVVRVTDGPFADFNGVVEDVSYEKNKVRVAVSIFGRSTPVELDFGQIEKSV